MGVKPCLGCGRLTTRPRCPTCVAARAALVDPEQRRARHRHRDTRRGTREQRGLGNDHRRQRAALITAWEATYGPLTACPRCGQPITPANPITAEHGLPRAHGGTEITELICRRCNSAAGGSVRRR